MTNPTVTAGDHHDVRLRVAGAGTVNLTGATVEVQIWRGTSSAVSVGATVDPTDHTLIVWHWADQVAPAGGIDTEYNLAAEITTAAGDVITVPEQAPWLTLVVRPDPA